MNEFFRKFATGISHAVGTPIAFVIAVLAVLIWALTGPLFGFSDTWQLVINTSTTIVTFLVVFIIQNTQNRDSKAIQLKLDELLRVIQEARTGMVDLEDMPDEELKKLDQEFRELREREHSAQPGNVTVPALDSESSVSKPNNKGSYES
jgi:low affinity Fe/Cu permease